MSSRKSKLQEDAYFRILGLLENNPNVSQRELAGKLNLSLGCVNYTLQALIEKGLLKVGNFKNNKNKLNYAYYLTPKGFLEKTTLTAHFLKRKVEEFEALKAEIEALQCAVDNSQLQITHDVYARK